MALLWLCWSAPALAQPLAVIELSHRDASELLGILRPLLAEGEAMSAAGNRLLLRAGPSSLAQLRTLVTTLDRPLRNLLIEVRTTGRTVSPRQQAGGSASVDSEGRGSVRLQASRHSTRARTANGFQVRTLEGRPAFIAVGTQVREARRGSHRPGFTAAPERRVQSGVYVTARVRGERVALEVAVAGERFEQGVSRRTSRTQAGTLDARLGEWITLGAVDTLGAGEAADPLGRQIRSGSRGHTTEVRVSVIE